MVKNSGALSFSECCSNGTMCPKRELAEKSSYARMNRIFMKCVSHFLLLKELSFKEKLFYISKFISNYFKYKFKNI